MRNDPMSHPSPLLVLLIGGLLLPAAAAPHGGSSGRYDALHEEAFRYAFLVDQIGTGEQGMAGRP